MSVFPIHIIELLTVALVLLAAYRVFHAQSSEAKSQASVSSQGPEEELRALAVNHTESMVPPSSENLRHTIPEQTKINSREQTKNNDNMPVCHQTALHNYIGDFF